MNEVMLAAIGWQELMLVLVIVILLFGSTKIPQVMRGLGQGVHEFKKGLHGEGEPLPPSDQAKNAPQEKQNKPG